MTKNKDLQIDIIDLILGLKMDKENVEVLMLDFEKTSPYHSMIGGVIMDIGYNFVDLKQAITPNNMSKPPENFIRDSTAKVVYEVLRNPVFYNELSKLQRVKDENNAFLYDYYRLLEKQKWFSKDISEEEISYEFTKFMYFYGKELAGRMKRHADRHRTSAEYWMSTQTYKDDPSGSGAAKLAQKAEMRYDRAKGSYRRALMAMEQEIKVEEQIDVGHTYLNIRLGKIQKNYQEFLYKMQTEESFKINRSLSPLDYQASWERDKNIFNQIGYEGIIEPWAKIMAELESKLNSNKDFLAISAYNLSSEESNFRITSRWLNTPRYANFVENYRSFCMQNLVSKAKNVKTEDLVNLIYSIDEKVLAQSIENITKTKSARSVSLETFIRDLHQNPSYKQSHTGVKDAFEQSSALVDAIRLEVKKVLSERK